jgi:hypothetical protein
MHHRGCHCENAGLELFWTANLGANTMADPMRMTGVLPPVLALFDTNLAADLKRFAGHVFRQQYQPVERVTGGEAAPATFKVMDLVAIANDNDVVRDTGLEQVAE